MQTIQTLQPALQSSQSSVQLVCCSNCGSTAERYRDDHAPSITAQRQPSIRTQCHHCDYLMVTCARTGRVLEAYAPGIPFAASFTTR